MIIRMTSKPDLECIKAIMLDRIGNSSAYFKSQQIGENDLTYEEKRSIAEELLSRNNVLFLQRFHKFMTLDDSSYFEHERNDYEVDFYLKEIEKLNDGKTSSVIVKNRRYEALQRLISDGDYFSDHEMRNRSPYLYEQMIGQYLTDVEKRELEEAPEGATFSAFLMRSIQRKHEENLMKEEELAEQMESDAYLDSDKSGGEEEDEESELESEDEDGSRNKSNSIAPEEKERLRNEFTNMMYQEFLSGKDDYDYGSVDHNEDYDNLKIKTADAEEKYFDSD